MRSLRGAAVAIGAALGAGVLCSWVAVGCSSGSTSPTSEGGTDGSTDARSDLSVADVTNEAANQDTFIPPDTFTHDASDGGVDASAVLAFADALVAARCKNWLACCPGGASAYDLKACTSTYGGYGWEGNLPVDQTALARGNIVIDNIKAAACLSAVTNLSCGSQTAVQWSAATQPCELVLTGTLAINGTGCTSSFECAAGAYCDPSGSGTCKPLATQGQPCNTVISSLVDPRADQMCSYLGSSSNGLYCDLIHNAADAATCQPLLANGANCVNQATSGPASGYYDDQACPASGALCGDNSLCGGSASYPYPANCTPFLITDAGGGG